MKLTKTQLKEMIREELNMVNESNIKVELGQMIAALKIKDKALEMVIRKLVFDNSISSIEAAVKKYMPEYDKK